MAGKKSVCVLMSGGLDSCVLAAELSRKGFEVYPLFLKSGLLWEGAELYWLKRFLKSLKAVKTLTILESPAQDLYRRHWSVAGKDTPDYHDPDENCFIPGRNILLLSKASVFCAQRGIRSITLANLNCNPFPDGTPGFYRQMEKTLSLGLGTPLRILAPYRRLSKTEIVRRGKNLPLHLTFSCIKPKGMLHCGRCAKCGERHDAFLKAGIPDRTRYALKPLGLRQGK